MLTIGSLVAPNNHPEQLLSVVQVDEVFDGRLIITCKRVGVLDAPKERYWHHALHEIVLGSEQKICTYERI